MHPERDRAPHPAGGVRLLSEEPVLALQGPRVVGKTTLLRHLADAHGVQIVDLDDAGVALHTGQRSYSPEDRIYVVPVDSR